MADAVLELNRASSLVPDAVRNGTTFFADNGNRYRIHNNELLRVNRRGAASLVRVDELLHDAASSLAGQLVDAIASREIPLRAQNVEPVLPPIDSRQVGRNKQELDDGMGF